MPKGASRLLEHVLYSGYIADGLVVREFEERLRLFVGNPLVESAGNYSSAIVLALYQAGVRPGDDVLACPEACLATNMPILNLFARPIWCDVDPQSGNIDPAEVERRVTRNTKAILYTHWGGDVALVDELNAIAARHGLKTVEDASEAFGAEHHGRRIGNLGSDFTVYSFGPIRHITTGEGAAVSFKDPIEAERFRALRRYGIHQPSFRSEDGEISPDSQILEPGLCAHMNNISAALGLEQLTEVDLVIERHRANGAYYEAELNGAPGIGLIRRPADSVSGYWVYTVLAERRDDLRRALNSDGIHSSRLHLRNDTYACFGTGLADLPGVAEFSARRLCLPSGWWVTDEDRESVVNRIRAGW